MRRDVTGKGNIAKVIAGMSGRQMRISTHVVRRKSE